jgi:CheY-like chemotaxis protein
MPLALIVEDDRDILLMFQEALGEVGFQTLIAGNAAQAIQLLQDNTPDIALIDLNMPGRPGTDVLEHINNTPRLNKVRRVVITANSLAEAKVEALGIDLFLVKPVSIAELMKLAQRLTN